MNFQIPHAATDLASPTIADQNAQSQLLWKLDFSLRLRILAVLHGSFLPAVEIESAARWT
jgi:hypothetical protein